MNNKQKTNRNNGHFLISWYYNMKRKLGYNNHNSENYIHMPKMAKKKHKNNQILLKSLNWQISQPLKLSSSISFILRENNFLTVSM
jgi:hypothetical protein